jgi:hypothetical protein
LSTGCNSKALYICRDKNSYLTLKDIKMKAIIAIIATIVSAFALTAFAAEPAKAPATLAATASAPAKAEVKKDEKKPAKSDAAKKEPAKADAKAAK